jgi:RNA polymerase sigma factor (sigma-70 family)
MATVALRPLLNFKDAVTVPIRDADETAKLFRIALEEAAKILTDSGNHEADDVANQAMFELANKDEREVVNPGGMIRIIARRRAWKMRARWDVRKDHEGAFADDDYDEATVGVDGGERARGVRRFRPADPELDPLDALVAQHQRELVWCAVAQLDERDRRIATLTYLDHPRLKAPAIAELLGLSEGTVRNALVRIRRELAEMLRDEPDFS